MAKFCSNGHQMEDTWEICPYCQKTGFQVTSAPAGKTRLEGEPAGPGPVPGTPPARKTVLFSDLRKTPVVGWFVAMDGEQKGEDFRIREGQNIIGSAPDADIVLSDKTISAKHASIRYRDQKFLLTDLDSTNGTYLNAQSESIAREELKDSDVVRIGGVSLKFKCL